MNLPKRKIQVKKVVVHCRDWLGVVRNKVEIILSQRDQRHHLIEWNEFTFLLDASDGYSGRLNSSPKPFLSEISNNFGPFLRKSPLDGYYPEIFCYFGKMRSELQTEQWSGMFEKEDVYLFQQLTEKKLIREKEKRDSGESIRSFTITRLFVSPILWHYLGLASTGHEIQILILLFESCPFLLKW